MEAAMESMTEEEKAEAKKKKEADAKSDKPFFDMLVFHKEFEVREMAGEILTKTTNYLLSMLEDHRTHLSVEVAENVENSLDRIIDTIV